MNNKEYGVKLDVDISKFTSKLTSAKTYTDQVMSEIKDRIKEPMEEVGKASKQSFTGRLETVGELSAQLAKLTIDYADVVAVEGKQSQSAIDLKEKIRALKQEIEGEGDALQKIGDDLSDLFEDEQDATNGMKDLGNEVAKTKNKGQGASVVFARFGDDVSKNINKGISSIKRFTLSLLGIRGAYSVLTRAANAYMAQDKDMHTRLQANWIALGSMLAPIIEYLIRLFQKLVAYINIFVKAFTGGKVDLLSKAMKLVEKNTKKTTKAVKSLNKELGTLDEIENLNFDQNKNDVDEADFGIGDALKEIQNIKLNEDLVKAMEWLGKKAKDLWNWFKKIKEKLDDWGIKLEDIILIAGGLYGAFKLVKIYDGIAKIIGVSGGTTGLYGMLTVFGMLVDFALAKKLGDDLATLSDVLYDKKDAEIAFADTQVKLLGTIKDKIKENNEKLKDGNLTEEERNKLIGENKGLVEEASEEYEEYLRRLKDGKKYTKEQREEIEKQTTAIEKVSGKTYKTTIKAKVEEDIQRNSFLYKLIHGILPEFQFTSSGGGGRHFAKGNVAYEPTMAEFGEYAGARSNPEITAPQNMMRETLFEALSEALPLVNSSGGDTVLYVNGRELARATYKDYQAEGNRLGNSSVAVRRVS